MSRIEPDGIVLKHKSGISKVYFTELPKEVRERFHSNWLMGSPDGSWPIGAVGILVLIALVAVIVLQLRKPRVPAENALTLIQNEVKAVQERLDNFGVTVSNTLQQSAQETNKRLDHRH